MKRYPMNGPSMPDQATLVYHWNNPTAAKEAFKAMKQKKPAAQS